MTHRALALLLALSGCKGFQPAADASSVTDGDLGSADRVRLGDGTWEAPDRGAHDRSLVDGAGAQGPCRPIPLPCLDPVDPKVIEVPTEKTQLQDALTSAKAGDIVQVKGLSVGSGWTIPAYVTLRGCGGAKLAGNVRFAGSGGTLEGFEVSGAGQVVANATGSYVVRFNRVAGSTLTGEAPVSARSIDGLVSADVTLVAESNWFGGGLRGVEARTKYDTGTHSVSLTVRNNIFTGVERPVEAAESGLVGKVKLTLEHNTFHGFKTAIGLFSLSEKTSLFGNLLQEGDLGVEGGPLEVQHSMVFQVTTASSEPPLSGTFAAGDPKLVNPAGGDLSLGAGSAAVDVIPSTAQVPAEDYRGCPRPVAVLSAAAKADIGALETQR